MTGRPVVVALALFWGLVLLGGVLEPGYVHARDFVSRLASFGAQWPAVGIAAIAMLGTAHAAGALLLRRAHARLAAALLLVAGVAGYVVAAFRVHCPGGAAGCPGAGAAPDRWTDVVHRYAVSGYEVALVTSMAAVAWWGLRRGDRRLAAGSLVAAVASAVAVLRIGGPDAGADQRLWLAVSTAWLLLLVARVGGRTVRPAAERP